LTENVGWSNQVEESFPVKPFQGQIFGILLACVFFGLIPCHAKGTPINPSYVEIEPVTWQRSRFENLNKAAFAALRADGSVVTWGDPLHGGDSSSVSNQLSSGVVQLYSTHSAFAALKDDGSVVTWGLGSKPVSIVWTDKKGNKGTNVIKLNGGGDSSTVANLLRSGVVDISSSLTTFVARKDNGTLVVWGGDFMYPLITNTYFSYGAPVVTPSVTLAIQGEPLAKTRAYPNSTGTNYLTNVLIFRNRWDATASKPFTITGVAKVYSSLGFFQAMQSNGTVTPLIPTNSLQIIVGKTITTITNSSPPNIPDDFTISESSISDIAPSVGPFAGLKNDGSVIQLLPYVSPTPSPNDVPFPASNLTSNVAKIFANDSSFAALTTDGGVLTWGDSTSGGATYYNDYLSGAFTDVSQQLSSGVKEVFSTGSAFAALKQDGSVITWGENISGGSPTDIQDNADRPVDLQGAVMKIAGTSSAFAALKSNGSVVCWGDSGGSPYFYTNSIYTNPFTVPVGVSNDLAGGIQSLIGNIGAFAALKSNGSVVHWGDLITPQSSNGINNGVARVFSSSVAFAALKSNGSVIAWGDTNPVDFDLYVNGGADASAVASRLSNVVILASPFVKLGQRSDPRLSIATIPDQTYSPRLSISLMAVSSNSVMPIRFYCTPTNIATVSGNRLTVLGAGTVTVIAAQQGTPLFQRATASRAIRVTPAPQSIRFTTLPVQKFILNKKVTLQAVSSVGLKSFDFASSSTNVAVVSGSALVLKGSGTSTITAYQKGNANYSPASATQTLIVK